MSTKSSQGHAHQGQVPFLARRKTMIVIVAILLIAAGMWIMTYTRAVATAPVGGPAPVISTEGTAVK